MAAHSASRGDWFRCLVAVLIVGAAAGLRLAFLEPLGTRAPYITFYPAVIIAALYGGLAAGLLATVTSALTASIFWIDPVGHAFQIGHDADLLAMLVFLAACAGISFICEARLRAQARARAAEAEITAQQQKGLLAAAHESESRYRSLFNGMSEGFALHELITDASGRPVDYRFLEVNPAFEHLTGLRRDQIIGKTMSEMLPGEDRRWIEHYAQVAMAGEAIQFENYSPALQRYYEVFAYRPALGQFAVIFVDITERKRAEAIREELVVRLQEKTAEMEGLLYATSHDLRSPLVNILGFCRRLRKEVLQLTRAIDDNTDASSFRNEAGPLVREQIPESLDYITGSAEKMDTLISGLLRLSRLGRPLLCRARVDMDELLGSLVASLKHQADEAHAQIRVEDLPACWGDASRIGQVFSNLIDNAIKYRDPSRELCVRIHGKAEEQVATYCVEDSGMGIKAEHQDKVWGLFSRLAPRGPVPGEGLGLTIVKRIVQQHGGRVWLESEPGTGSRFFVAMPQDERAFDALVPTQATVSAEAIQRDRKEAGHEPRSDWE